METSLQKYARFCDLKKRTKRDKKVTFRASRRALAAARLEKGEGGFGEGGGISSSGEMDRPSMAALTSFRPCRPPLTDLVPPGLRDYSLTEDVCDCLETVTVV